MAQVPLPLRTEERPAGGLAMPPWDALWSRREFLAAALGHLGDLC